MNMTSIVKYVLVLCVLFVAGYTNAQITINTNFSVLSNQPIDSRDTLTTLADTSSVTWTFPGLLSYVADIDEFWYYTGAQWRKLFDGTTIPSSAPDSLIVYAPAHGLSDTIALYGYVPVKADFTRANSTSIDSVFIAYAIDAPDADSLLLIFSGVLTYGSWHGKELNTQYYLQDDGSDDTTPGTVSVPTAIASDSLTLFLREVGSDIAGQLRRVAMPSPLITAFGGNPASPTDTVVQLAISTLYLPAGLAQPGTIFTLSYPTQSYNPTYQQIFPNTNPLTPSYAWLWDGAYATRIVNIPTSVNLQDTNYGVLGTLILLPIDSLGSLPPTDSLVAMWVDTNYTANNLRLANGSLLYYIGNGTRQSPDYIWQIIDDISYDAGDTNWEKIIKKINQPGGSVPAIRNDLPNESILIDPNNNDLVIGADSLDNTGEIEFFVLTPVDSQNVVFFIGQRDSSSVVAGEGFPMDALISSFGDEDGVIGINFDYFSTVWNTAMFGDSMLVAAYPSSTLTYVLEHLPRSPADTMSAVLVQDWVTKRVYIRDADSFGSEPDSSMYATVYALADTAAAIRGDIPAPDGNGLFDASNDEDTLQVTSVFVDPGTGFRIYNTNNSDYFAMEDDIVEISAGNQNTLFTLADNFFQIDGSVSMLFSEDEVYLSPIAGDVIWWSSASNTTQLNAGDTLRIRQEIITSDSMPISESLTDKLVLLFDESTRQFSAISPDSLGGGDGSIYTADGTLTGDRTVDGDGNLFVLNNTSATAMIAGGVVANDSGNAGIAVFDDVLGALSGYDGAAVILTADTTTGIELWKTGIYITADTLDATGVTTFLGFPSGGSQTLSTSNDSLTISEGNSVKLPITELLRDSVTTTTMTVDLETRYQKVVQIDMATATNLTLTINNPTDAGVYTFHFIGTSGTDNVTWPAAFLDAAGTALGTDALTTGTMYTCYYSSTDAKYYCK